MTVGAWIMLVFGILVLYGGLYLAIARAKKSQ
jgi:hypothetical protein